MSAYVNFFIRVGDNFAPIGSFSRSTKVFQSFSGYAPWEKVRVVTKDELDYIRSELRDSREEYEDMMKTLETKLVAVKSFDNSAQEKLEIIEEIMSEQQEVRSIIDEYNDALTYMSYLEDIIDEGRNGAYYDGYKDIINPAAYLYVGIEIGCPTTEDIED